MHLMIFCLEPEGDWETLFAQAQLYRQNQSGSSGTLGLSRYLTG